MGAGFFAAIAFAVFLAALRAAGPVPAAFFFSDCAFDSSLGSAPAFPDFAALAVACDPRRDLPLSVLGAEDAPPFTEPDFTARAGFCDAAPFLAAICLPSSHRSANHVQRIHPSSLQRRA